MSLAQLLHQVWQILLLNRYFYFKKEFSQSTFYTILNNFYIDDLLKSVPILLRKEISPSLSKAGFHITKWISNNSELLATIPNEDIATGLESLMLPDPSNAFKTALRIKWNVKSDQFCFNIDLPVQPITKRGMLSVLNSVLYSMDYLCCYFISQVNFLFIMQTWPEMG